MKGSRPDRVILVLGTGTEVGKTWLSDRLLRRWAAGGVRVQARKPAQSFDPDDPSPRDADVLAAATGEAPERVCPPARWYRVALAPPMAAEALGGDEVRLADLVAELGWSEASAREEAGVGSDPASTVGLVEAAGGVRSPQAVDGDCVDFAVALAPDAVVVVADAGLGTLSLVRHAVRALVGERVVIFLNRFDPSVDVQRRNRDWLVERESLEVFTDPASLADALAGAVTGLGVLPRSAGS